MKPAYLITLFLLSFILINCSKETSSPNEPEAEVSEPTPEPMPEELVQEVYFTFNVDDSIPTDESQDDWIILNDNEGALLDYRAFEKGEQLIFEKRSDSIPDTFSVTLLKVQFITADPCNGDVWHSIETFPEIEKGSVWTFSESGIPDNDLPDELGEFKLTVTDIPGTDGFRLFKSSFVSFQRHEFFSGGTVSPDNTNNTMRLELDEISLFENTRYLVSIMDEGLNLNFKFFENPILGEDVNLNYGEFEQYDTYAFLPSFPPNLGNSFKLLGQTRGMNRSNDRGYLLQQIKNTDIENPLPMGFLDEFDYFKTYFSISFENFNYVYNRFGLKPEITIPGEPILLISNAQIPNFDMGTDFDYIRKVNRWRKGSDTGTCSYTAWGIHSNKINYPKNLIMPEYVIDLYDLLELNDLELSNSTFYLQADSYDNFIANKFKIPSATDAIEEYTEEYIQFSH